VTDNTIAMATVVLFVIRTRRRIFVNNRSKSFLNKHIKNDGVEFALQGKIFINNFNVYILSETPAVDSADLKKKWYSILGLAPIQPQALPNHFLSIPKAAR
jgi:hypothetical protein